MRLMPESHRHLWLVFSKEQHHSSSLESLLQKAAKEFTGACMPRLCSIRAENS